jgi:hypothetical protein
VVERLSQLITERLSSVAEAITRPLELLEQVGSVVENYAFGPAMQWHALQPALVTAKETLRPVANLMASSPEFDWWWDSIALTDQRWLGVNGDLPPTSIELAEALPRAIAEESWSCWWVSLVSRHVPRTTRGPIDSSLTASLACHEDHEVLHEEKLNVWTVEIPEGATVYEIQRTADWIALVERFPREVVTSRAPEWARWTGHSGPWVLPDWERISAKYDAVHISFAAYLASAYTAIPIGTAHTILVGWHPDETLWLGRAPKARQRLK